MTNSGNDTGKLIIITVLIGIVLLIAAAFVFRKQEQVTLPVKFEEFTDFECPACAAYYPVVKKLVTQYSTENVNFVFHNFPLTSIHPNSYRSALAGQAAKLQGKFDEYGDILFTHQDKLSDTDLLAYAQQLGLNTDQFTLDMNSAAVKKLVDDDIDLGNNLGINATPTFYINGQKVVFKTTDDPAQVLKDLLDQKIALGITQAAAKK